MSTILRWPAHRGDPQHGTCVPSQFLVQVVVQLHGPQPGQCIGGRQGRVKSSQPSGSCPDGQMKQSCTQAPLSS
jgi:hypothetical protein